MEERKEEKGENDGGAGGSQEIQSRGTQSLDEDDFRHETSITIT